MEQLHTEQPQKLQTPFAREAWYYALALQDEITKLDPTNPEDTNRLAAINAELDIVFDPDRCHLLDPYQAFGGIVAYVETEEGGHAFRLNDVVVSTNLEPNEAKKVMRFVKGQVTKEDLMGGDLDEVAAHTLKNIDSLFVSLRHMVAGDGDTSIIKLFLQGQELGIAAKFNIFGNIARLIEASKAQQAVSAKQVGIVLEAIKVNKEAAFEKYEQDRTDRTQIITKPQLEFGLMQDEQIDAKIALHIVELVQNAFHCGATNVSVDHCYDKTGRYVCYAVEDNGRGVDREIAGKIFELGETHREGGTGKGLFFFREHVIKAGGRVVMTTTTERDSDSIRCAFEPDSREIYIVKASGRETLKVVLTKEQSAPVEKHTTRSGTTISFMLPRKLDQTA